MLKIDNKGLIFWLVLFFLVAVVLQNFWFFLIIIFLLFFFLKKTGKKEMITNFFSKLNFKKNNSEPIMETINPNKYSSKRIIWTLSFIFLFFIVFSFASSFWVVIGAGE